MSTPSNVDGRLRALARSGVLLGASAASIVAAACFAFGESVSGSLLVAITALTVSSYAIDRIVDEARRGTHSRLLLAQLIALASASFVLCLYCFLSRGQVLAAALSCLFPLSVVFYTLPVLPKRFGVRRVKDLPLVKAFYTAGMWGLLVLLSAATSEHAKVSSIVALGMFVFGKLVIGVIASDIKDTRFDAMDDVKTFPVVFGIERTIHGLQVWNLVCIFATLVVVMTGILPSYMLVAELHGVIVACLLLRMQRTSCQGSRWLISEVFMDASYVLLFPAVKIGALALAL